ncbi:zinc knuckle CX2CX4HX4C containing protein [Tanacetum coccineum]
MEMYSASVVEIAMLFCFFLMDQRDYFSPGTDTFLTYFFVYPDNLHDPHLHRPPVKCLSAFLVEMPDTYSQAYSKDKVWILLAFEKILESLRASESDVNPKPLKSILKRSIQSPIAKDNNGVRKVSMNPTTMVWEVETDYASPIRNADESGFQPSLTSERVLTISSSKQQGGPNANEPMADANIVGASMDASDTNSLTNATKQAAGPKVNTSFASVIKSNQNKVVQITEHRNEEHMEGAAVTIPFEEAKIKKVPMWVKLHHVPIVAYSEVGLSLITTQIGKPIRLDAFTSNMCLQSWGRNAYARALIEVSAEDAPKEELVIAIPLGKDKEEKCLKRPKEVTTTVVTNVEVNHSKDVAIEGLDSPLPKMKHAISVTADLKFFGSTFDSTELYKHHKASVTSCFLVDTGQDGLPMTLSSR